MIQKHRDSPLNRARLRHGGDWTMRIERDAMNDTGELRPKRGTGSCLPTIHPEQKREHRAVAH